MTSKPWESSQNSEASSASLSSFPFVTSANGLGTAPSIGLPVPAPTAGREFAFAMASAPGAADAAAGRNVIHTNGCANGNAVDAAANGSSEVTPPAGLSDVPDVLRQHLDRRKAQLQSMQQRLAKLSHECDSLQGMVKAA